MSIRKIYIIVSSDRTLIMEKNNLLDFVGILKDFDSEGNIKDIEPVYVNICKRTRAGSIEGLAHLVVLYHGNNWKEKTTYEPLESLGKVKKTEKYVRFNNEEEELFEKSISENLKKFEDTGINEKKRKEAKEFTNKIFNFFSS